MEAVEASKAFGKPVRLDVAPHRTISATAVPPMARSRIRVSFGGLERPPLSNNATPRSATDFTTGLGEMYSAFPQLPQSPYGNLTISEGIFTLTTGLPYNYGEVTQLLNEIYDSTPFATGSRAQHLLPGRRHRRELMTDQIEPSWAPIRSAFRRHVVQGRAAARRAGQVREVGKGVVRVAPGTAAGDRGAQQYKAGSPR